MFCSVFRSSQGVHSQTEVILRLGICSHSQPRLWKDQLANKFGPKTDAGTDELEQRVTATLDNVTGDKLQHVWLELNYQLDICCVTGGAHIEIIPIINL